MFTKIMQITHRMKENSPFFMLRCTLSYAKVRNYPYLCKKFNVNND